MIISMGEEAFHSGPLLNVPGNELVLFSQRTGWYFAGLIWRLVLQSRLSAESKQLKLWPSAQRAPENCRNHKRILGFLLRVSYIENVLESVSCHVRLPLISDMGAQMAPTGRTGRVEFWHEAFGQIQLSQVYMIRFLQASGCISSSTCQWNLK